MNPRLRGYASVFGAAFFWGASGTLAKFLFQHQIPVMLVVQSRVLIAASFLTVALLFIDRKLLRISLSDLKDFALLGIIGVALCNYAFYMAVNLTNVGLAILMEFTAPAMVAIYVLVRKQERVSKVKTISILLSLAGSAIMLGAFNPSMHITAIGIFFGILSAVCFAFFNIYYKIANKHYSVWTAVTWTLITAGSFWLVLDGLGGVNPGHLATSDILILIGFSFSSIVLPYFFYFTGLKYLAPSTAIIVATLEPVVAILTSYAFLGEAFGLSQIAGGIFIISAVILLEAFRE